METKDTTKDPVREVVLSFRLAKDVVEKVDALVLQARRARRGHRATRSDLLREIVLNAVSPER
jgi:hypothetical protein